MIASLTFSHKTLFVPQLQNGGHAFDFLVWNISVRSLHVLLGLRGFSLGSTASFHCPTTSGPPTAGEKQRQTPVTLISGGNRCEKRTDIHHVSQLASASELMMIVVENKVSARPSCYVEGLPLKKMLAVEGKKQK